MTDAQFAALQTEIETDPGDRGWGALLSAGNDTGLAEILNAVEPGILITVPTTQRALIKTLASRGKDKALWDAADAGNPAAWSTRNVLTSGAFADEKRGIDVHDADSQVMLAGLVSTGVLSTTDRTVIEALGKRPGSRAEQVAGAGLVVTDDDAMKLRRAVLNG